MALRLRGAAVASDEGGFTLVELLVVVIIIGLLAAVAIPAFFNQKEKGSDTAAVSNIRNLQTMVESCRTEADDYSQCQTQSQLHADTIPVGPGAGEAQVVLSPLGEGGYGVSGLSKTGTTFMLYTRDGASAHLCKPASGEALPKGKCVSGGPYAVAGYGTW